MASPLTTTPFPRTFGFPLSATSRAWPSMQQKTPAITLVSPFPPEAYPELWGWLNEFPSRNFDDYGPRTCAEFIAEMERRAMMERSWGVLKDGQLCGAIGYLPLTERLGMTRGICFTRSAWGRETTMTAVRAVVAEIFGWGVEKISASFFADNPRIYRFLRDLGAVDEGLLRKHTLRDGGPIDVQVVAIFKEDFQCLSAAL